MHSERIGIVTKVCMCVGTYFLYPISASNLQAAKLLIPLAQDNTIFKSLSGLGKLYLFKKSSGVNANAVFISSTIKKNQKLKLYSIL